MARRGESRRDFQPDPNAQPVQRARHIGLWRVTAARASGRAQVIELDPGEFRCRQLADELGAEWADFGEVARPHPTGVFAYRQAIRDLCTFVDTTAGDQAAACSLAREVPDTAFHIREWMRRLPTRWPEGSQRPYYLANFLLALIRFRGLHGERPLAPQVQRLTTMAAPVRPGGLKELDEFTRAEKREIVRAGWADVRALEARLELGRELVAAGGHPAEQGWLERANLLWGLANDAVTASEIWANLPQSDGWPAELRAVIDQAGIEFSTRLARYQLVVALTGLLYPRNIDLQAFRLLLVAATGHTPEEVTGLTEEDVEYLPGGVRLRMIKRRANRVRSREFRDLGEAGRVTHPDRSGLNVREILERLSAVTAETRRRSGIRPAFLFTCARVLPRTMRVGSGELAFAPFESTDSNGCLAAWAKRANVQVTGKLDIRRLRKSVKVEKAVAFRGMVNDIADDHTAETFLGHYAHGTTLRVLSGNTVTTAQQTWLDRALEGPVVLDEPAVEALAGPEALEGLGLTADQAERIRQGELDMGVTSCRDPYDSPYNRPGELCAVAPLRCLECRNAFVLPSNLPQLLLFADHLEGLRKRLSPPHFQQVWGLARTNLASVLAERGVGELEVAQQQISEQGLRLQLPLSSLVEFDA